MQRCGVVSQRDPFSAPLSGLLGVKQARTAAGFAADFSRLVTVVKTWKIVRIPATNIRLRFGENSLYVKWKVRNQLLRCFEVTAGCGFAVLHKIRVELVTKRPVIRITIKSTESFYWRTINSPPNRREARSVTRYAERRFIGIISVSIKLFGKGR